ncbi:hypothetical protein P154DRAFT_579791 [Amniculicola lignicola CBS 123094]|uniref:Homeobox domain-containing protein n=1 Tax=Amniculicola lignicola CBS 123094 TaxID=1392246 RepID=A0A6A5W651_9PLEO|nr:hypothetical protein P154DRAFT_579791 [Amniculicola lignicola CBS 123094]
MLSPNGLKAMAKANASSIWSNDSGYGSAPDNIPEPQPAASSSHATCQYSNVEGLGLVGLQYCHSGSRVSLKTEEAAIDPLVTQLSVFTTRDTSAQATYYTAPSSNGRRSCPTCAFWRTIDPDDDVKCPDCRAPEFVKPSSLLLDTTFLDRNKTQVPQQSNTLYSATQNTVTRCSACELSAFINPKSPSVCHSCAPSSAFFSSNSSSEQVYKVKRSRAGRNTKLPPHALTTLQAWLDAHSDNPYPDAETKQQLAQQCSITEKQVNTWFTNARARQLSPLDTWLNSGSEDEAAKESDIESAAQTPTYTTGFTLLPDNKPTTRAYKAGSVSGSSAFSAGALSQPQVNRRGKKKIYRSHQVPNAPVNSSSPSNATATATEQEMWQCTFCLRPLVPKSWRRHEETQHHHRAQWTCMLYGPRLSFPPSPTTPTSATTLPSCARPATSSSRCAFCMLKNPSEDHFLKAHRISECAKRSARDRTFYRPDHLRQHVRNFHGSALFDVVQARWKKGASDHHEEEGEKEGWPCGFCGEWLDKWDKRETHIANHFKDGMTMAQWKVPFPGHPDVEKKGKGRSVKTDKEKEKEHGHTHPHLHGLAKLGKQLSTISTRSLTSLRRPKTPASTCAQSIRTQPQTSPFYNHANTQFTDSFSHLPIPAAANISPNPNHNPAVNLLTPTSAISPNTSHYQPNFYSEPPILPNINMSPLMHPYHTHTSFADWPTIDARIIDAGMHGVGVGVGVGVTHPHTHPHNHPHTHTHNTHTHSPYLTNPELYDPTAFDNALTNVLQYGDASGDTMGMGGGWRGGWSGA